MQSSTNHPFFRWIFSWFSILCRFQRSNYSSRTQKVFRTQSISGPLGNDLDQLILSWHTETSVSLRNFNQNTSQIQCTQNPIDLEQDLLWSRGKILFEFITVRRDGCSRVSRVKIHWKVRSWDDYVIKCPIMDCSLRTSYCNCNHQWLLNIYVDLCPQFWLLWLEESYWILDFQCDTHFQYWSESIRYSVTKRDLSSRKAVGGGYRKFLTASHPLVVIVDDYKGIIRMELLIWLYLIEVG